MTRNTRRTITIALACLVFLSAGTAGWVSAGSTATVEDVADGDERDSATTDANDETTEDETDADDETAEDETGASLTVEVVTDDGEGVDAFVAVDNESSEVVADEQRGSTATFEGLSNGQYTVHVLTGSENWTDRVLNVVIDGESVTKTVEVDPIVT